MAEVQSDYPLSQTAGALEVRRVAYSEEENGRGVFALRPIPRGALVEVAHAIRIPKTEHDAFVEKTVFNHYTYCVPGGDYFLALGLGSLFNHRDPPNLDYRVDAKNDIVRYYTCASVAAGEELFIFYGANLWFADGATVSGAKATRTAADDDNTDFLGVGLEDE
jgi:SET domain-containing protein